MIDVAKVTVISGKGGDGSFSFRRVKYIAKGGPDGGDGGNGGSIFLVATDQKQTLIDYADKPKFKAADGQYGRGQQCFGERGDDLEIPVPLGTIVWDISDHQEKRKIGEIINLGDRLLVAQGGQGGRGNIHFKSSTNRTPMEYEEGGDGEKRVLLLELRLLADIGFVGFPNAGKSTLLSVLTRARPKVANYPFTTLEPYLGIMEISAEGSTKDVTRYIVADIPGLIEEASQGKGLGYQFLRHIERCRVLVYLLYVPDESLQLTAEEQVALLQRQYEILTHELEDYNPSLINRPSIVVVNKRDVLADDFSITLAKKWSGEKPLLISAATHAGIDELKQLLHEIVQKTPKTVVVDSDADSEEGIEQTSLGIPVFSLPSTKHKPKMAYRPPLKK